MDKFEMEWKRYCDSKGGGAVTMNVKDVAKHFAQWQKEQMIKDVIDTIVVESYGVDKVDGKWENVILPKIQIWSDKLSIGDKVKVIIIKE